MGNQIITQPQTFNAGVTVVGNISASGTIYGTVPLADLAATGASNGQVVTFNGSTWTPSTPSTPSNTINTQTNGGASTAASTLNFTKGLAGSTTSGVTTVSLPTGTTQQVLTYNNSTATWVASAVPTELPATASNGQVLTYNGSTSTWVASAAPGSAALATGGLQAWVNFSSVPTGLSYTRTGTTVTVTHTSHGFATGMVGEFTSATDTGVNGSGKIITVINANSYSFQTTATGANGTLIQRSMIRASSNVSSVVSNGTGDYTVNFTTPMIDANYAMSLCCSAGPGGYAPTPLTYISSTGSIRFVIYADVMGYSDRDTVSVMITR